MTLHVPGNDTSIRKTLEHSARTEPERVYAIYEDQEITVSDLNARVDRFANALAGLGLVKGDRVAIMLPNHPDHFIAFLACAKTGLVQVPVNSNLRGASLEYLVEHSAPKAVIADTVYAEQLLPALARTTDSIIAPHTALTTLLDTLNDGPWAWQGPNGRPDNDDYWLATGAVLTTWNLLLALPDAAYVTASLTTQTPSDALNTSMGVVDYWVGRLIGHSLEPGRMTALYNDQGGTSGVPAARRSSTNTNTVATRTETALRRLVGMIAGTVEFTYR